MGPGVFYYRDDETASLRRLDRRHDPTSPRLLLGQEASYVQHKCLTAPAGARAVSAFTSGPRQVQLGPGRSRRADLALIVPRGEGAATVEYSNMHGFYHTTGFDSEDGAASRSGPIRRKPGHSAHLAWCRRYAAEEEAGAPPVAAELNADTKFLDDFNAGYVAALSAVDPARFTATYESVSSCALFCGNGGCDPRTFLRAHEDAVLPPTELGIPPGDSVPASDMLAAVLRAVPHVDGVVTLEGGKQRDAGRTSSLLLGFIPQKLAATPEQLGEGARVLSAAMCGGDEQAGEAYLNKVCRERPPVTVAAKKNYSSTTISLQLLAYLVREKGFHAFRIRHLLVYAAKNFLGADVVRNLLQWRWNQKREGNLLMNEGEVAGEPRALSLPNLPSSCSPQAQASEGQVETAAATTRPLTLLSPRSINSVFGFMLVQCYHHRRTDVITGESLARRSKRGDAVSACLVAVVPAGDGRPKLIYVCDGCYTGRSKSLTQVGAGILNLSKVVYFGLISRLLDQYDPRQICVMYQDTDSLLVSTASADLAATARDPAAFRRSVMPEIFENAESPASQHLTWKIEGTWRKCLVRNIKVYYLSGLVGGKAVAKRWKGVPRKLQKNAPEELFSVRKTAERGTEPRFSWINMKATATGRVLISKFIRQALGGCGARVH